MPGNELVRSLARGLDLVRLLAEADGGMSMAEIVTATELKRSTVHNLLRTLMSREFITKAAGLYRLGPSVHSLAAADNSGGFLRKAEEQLQALADRFPDAIVSFSEPIGGRVFARFHKYPHRLLLERNAGMEMLPYQTASGLAVLAFADPETRHTIQVHHPFQLDGAPLWQTEENLERFLTEVRERRYAVPPFHNASNYVLVAVPVLSESDRVLGVFGIARHGRAGPQHNENTTMGTIAAMRAAAATLAQVASGSPPAREARNHHIRDVGE